MPSNATVKIKLALRQQPVVLFLSILCALTLIGVASVQVWQRPTQVRLGLPDRAFKLEVAKGAADRAQGLAGRDSLPQDQGMLFIFPKDKKPCMWMKDMRFPLDILWLDAQQRIVHMARNLSPLTYPQVFCPRAPAAYVVELNAGQTQAAHVYVGQRLSF